MRCASDESVSLFSATEASAAGLCGIESSGSLSAFCESLDVLDSPYTCEEASHESFIRGNRFRLHFAGHFFSYRYVRLLASARALFPLASFLTPRAGSSVYGHCARQPRSERQKLPMQ